MLLDWLAEVREGQREVIAPGGDQPAARQTYSSITSEVCRMPRLRFHVYIVGGEAIWSFCDSRARVEQLASLFLQGRRYYLRLSQLA